MFFSMETVAVEKNDSITPKITYFHQLFSMGEVAIEKSTAGDEVSIEKTAGNDNKWDIFPCSLLGHYHKWFTNSRLLRQNSLTYN